MGTCKMWHKGRNHDQRGEKAPLAKLTTEDVLEIKKLLGKITYQEIAETYNVSVTAIADIKLKRTWGHLV